jgi:hypothetical protein
MEVRGASVPDMVLDTTDSPGIFNKITSPAFVENSVGMFVVCYRSFPAINFPFFLPYFFPALHVFE